jgi:hypothetical protein
MNYKQEDTQKIINEMRTAARRTSNHDISHVLKKAIEQMSEMECMIFRLVDEKNELLTDNQMIADKLEETTQRLQEANARGNGFDYDALLRDFVESGKPFARILLERHGSPSGTAWYTPQLKRVRDVIERMKLPVEAIQRTSSKNPDVTPVMYLLRTDCEE